MSLAVNLGPAALRQSMFGCESELISFFFFLLHSFFYFIFFFLGQDQPTFSRPMLLKALVRLQKNMEANKETRSM